MAPIKSSILKSRPLGKGWGPRDVAVRQECWVDMLQEEEPLPGTKSRLLCSTWKWIIQGDTCSEKARDFTGKGCSGGKQWGEGDWKDSSATWLAVPGFIVMGFVSGSSLANQPDSRSFLVVLHCSANEKDSGRLVGPKDWCLLLIFLEFFFWLVVACYFHASYQEALMQIVTVVPGQRARFQSVFPLTDVLENFPTLSLPIFQ